MQEQRDCPVMVHILNEVYANSGSRRGSGVKDCTHANIIYVTAFQFLEPLVLLTRLSLGHENKVALETHNFVG